MNQAKRKEIFAKLAQRAVAIRVSIAKATAEEIAARMGLNARQLDALERGERIIDVPLVVTWAEALRVPPGLLLGKEFGGTDFSEAAAEAEHV